RPGAADRSALVPRQFHSAGARAIPAHAAGASAWPARLAAARPGATLSVARRALPTPDRRSPAGPAHASPAPWSPWQRRRGPAGYRAGWPLHAASAARRRPAAYGIPNPCPTNRHWQPRAAAAHGVWRLLRDGRAP